MRSLIRYLIKNYAFLLFLLLEVTSLVFIFNFNSFQRARYLNSSNKITASVYQSFNSVYNYFELAKINRELAEENARLRSGIIEDQKIMTLDSTQFSKNENVFSYISARIINNSVNKQFNYITLNKGRKHGVKPDQGIISAEGLVGVITNVSESFSVGLSVLNQRWSVSAKLKNTGFFGSLAWNGSDYRFANLLEIPFHVQLSIGDTVITSGYSSIFPEGIIIGTIENFEKPEGENYYNIDVLLSTNFKALNFVEIIDNKKKVEIKELEKISQDGQIAN